MKYLSILSLLFLYTSCYKSQEKITINKKYNMSIDTTKLQKSKAIIEAEFLKEEAGGKYSWTTVKIIKILNNKTEYKFPEILPIGYYSWKDRIPKQGKFILYLTPFPFGSDSLNSTNQWILIDGNGKSAVEKIK